MYTEDKLRRIVKLKLMECEEFNALPESQRLALIEYGTSKVMAEYFTQESNYWENSNSNDFNISKGVLTYDK